MNTTTATTTTTAAAPDLRRLKRDLERAVEAVFAVARTTRRDVWIDTFYVTAATTRRFEKFVAKYADVLATPEAVEAVAKARAAYVAVTAAATAEKARLAEKRARLAAINEAGRLALTLARYDKRATPETYRAIRAELEPLVSVYAVRVEESFRRRLPRDLAEVNKSGDLRGIRWNWFTVAEDRTMVVRPDIDDILRREAKVVAEDTVAAFCAKLAGKVDREKAEGAVVTGVASTTIDRWSSGTTVVRLSDGSEQEWYTQVIVNQSCLGKLFNQWPTRRVR